MPHTCKGSVTRVPRGCPIRPAADRSRRIRYDGPPVCRIRERSPPVPTAADPAAAPVAIRTRVRAAVEEAWQAAVASGTLAAVEDACRGPAGGGRAAGQRRVRRPRHEPRDEARPAAAPRAARHRRGASLRRSRPAATTRCSPPPRSRGPGFVNLRVADAAYEELVAGILGAPAEWGRIPAVNPRSVNVEFVSANPDRAAHRGQRARRVRR